VDLDGSLLCSLYRGVHPWYSQHSLPAACLSLAELCIEGTAHSSDGIIYLVM